MREKTEAIVLNSTKCTSNILLVKVFTKDRGILTLSTHIHIKKNKNTHIFNPLSILSIEMEYRENKEIMKLVSVEIAHSLIALEANPIKLTLSLFIAELFYKSVRQQEKDSTLFSFFKESILMLNEMNKNVANFHLLFMIKLTNFLGFAPMSMEENTDYLDFCNGKFCNSIPSHHDYAEGNIVGKLSQLFLLEPNELLIYPLSQRERNEILDLLLRYYRFHLPSFPTLKCVEVLRELYG